MSDKLRFGEILVRAGVLERSLLESLVREQDAMGGDLGELLVARGCLDETTMVQAVSKALNRPIVNLDQASPEPRALQLLTREICLEHMLFPIEVERSKSGEHLHVAMANPLDVRAIKIVMQQARLRIQPLVCSAREVKQAIARYYGGVVPTVEVTRARAPASPPGLISPPGAAPGAAAIRTSGAPSSSARSPSTPSLTGRVDSSPSQNWRREPTGGSGGAEAPPSVSAVRAPEPPPQRALEPAPSRAPDPPPPRGPADAMFDFAVMDLSQLGEADPPPLARVPTPAPAAAPAGPIARFGQAPPAPGPLFPQTAPPAPLFGQAPASHPIGAPAPLFGGNQTPGAAAASASLGADLVDLLDNTSDDSLGQTSDLARPPIVRAPPPARQSPDTTTPGFGAVRGRRGSELPSEVPRGEPRPPRPLESPPMAPQAVRGISSGGLPPLPGRAAPSGPPMPASPLQTQADHRIRSQPNATSAPATSKPMPPLPPSLRISKVQQANSEPVITSATGRIESRPSIPATGRAQSRPSIPATPPALQRAGALEPVHTPGVIDDVGHENELRSILERYTTALEEGHDSADVLIAQFVSRYGARRPERPLETLMGTLDLQIGRTPAGLGRLVLGLIRHLAERGLIDLAELLGEVGSDLTGDLDGGAVSVDDSEEQTVPPRQS